MAYRRRFSQFFPILFYITDLISISISFALANLIRFNQYDYFANNYSYLFIFILLVWSSIFIVNKLFEIDRDNSITDEINRLLQSIIILLGIIFSFWVAFKAYFYSREHLFYFFLFFSFLTVSWRLLFILSIQYYRSKGYNLRNVIIVGYGEEAIELNHYIDQNPGLGYIFQGYYDKFLSSNKIKGDINLLENHAVNDNIDIIYCVVPRLTTDDIKRIIDFAENNLIKVKLVYDISIVRSNKVLLQQYGDIPILNISALPLDSFSNRFIKRVFDFVFSFFVMILLLSWLVPFIALLIKFESKGPVFFRQNRHGRDNRYFRVFKFRTMRVNQEADNKQATKDDPRITRIGAFLRKTSIDEIPQFINVFIGDMSVVGPRPHPIKLNESFVSRIDRFMQRHAVKPGITGLAQAKGFRGETAEFHEMYGRVKLDRFYVKNWSIWLDIQIIFLTIVSLIKKNDKAY